MKKTSKRLSAADYAYEVLKERIIELQYQPAEHLLEDQLAKDLEISRTPLRQALYRLELEGLVNKQANGRMIVTPVTLEEAREVFVVREMMEGLVAKEASERMSQDDLYRLEDTIELMKRAVERARSQDFLKHSEEFHGIIQECSHNDTAKRFLLQLENKVDRYRRISGYKNPAYALNTPLEEHIEILQFLKEKSSKEVEDLMRAHIRRSLKTIEETIATNSSSHSF
ncbi:transcriptional regulator, GntR family [Geomicrobium sp. JCM 19037]|uniref:GntR family transcriptional regulator n=1 Tax=unclassified Geomicrobium TaxID=2628951 RepID=UPI00045F169D|nr:MULTISPECIES: GntR family transcriptional regulator [unclassified Geomicrobium]GAK03795.1 transcriptional regulator, GntR family [Geomicrobium sp. JCM 19037]GAK13387.1 propionate catabolism operon transcriptional regulator of GntR family [Geomicrobium sp. JCM 19039]